MKFTNLVLLTILCDILVLVGLIAAFANGLIATKTPLYAVLSAVIVLIVLKEVFLSWYPERLECNIKGFKTVIAILSVIVGLLAIHLMGLPFEKVYLYRGLIVILTVDDFINGMREFIIGKIKKVDTSEKYKDFREFGAQKNKAANSEE